MRRRWTKSSRMNALPFWFEKEASEVSMLFREVPKAVLTAAVNSGKDEKTGAGQWSELSDETVLNLGSHPFGEGTSGSNNKLVKPEPVINKNAVSNGESVIYQKTSESITGLGETFSSPYAYMLWYAVRHFRKDDEKLCEQWCANDGKIEVASVGSSLPSHLYEEIKSFNASNLDAYKLCKVKKDEEMNHMTEWRQEDRSMLSKATVWSLEGPFFCISTDQCFRVNTRDKHSTKELHGENQFFCESCKTRVDAASHGEAMAEQATGSGAAAGGVPTTASSGGDAGGFDTHVADDDAGGCASHAADGDAGNHADVLIDGELAPVHDAADVIVVVRTIWWEYLTVQVGEIGRATVSTIAQLHAAVLNTLTSNNIGPHPQPEGYIVFYLLRNGNERTVEELTDEDVQNVTKAEGVGNEPHPLLVVHDDAGGGAPHVADCDAGGDATTHVLVDEELAPVHVEQPHDAADVIMVERTFWWEYRTAPVGKIDRGAVNTIDDLHAKVLNTLMTNNVGNYPQPEGYIVFYLLRNGNERTVEELTDEDVQNVTKAEGVGNEPHPLLGVHDDAGGGAPHVAGGDATAHVLVDEELAPVHVEQPHDAADVIMVERTFWWEYRTVPVGEIDRGAVNTIDDLHAQVLNTLMANNVGNYPQPEGYIVFYTLHNGGERTLEELGNEDVQNVTKAEGVGNEPHPLVDEQPAQDDVESVAST